MSRPAWAPHAPYTVSDASFERIRMYSDQLDIPVHVHVHETAFEVEDAFAKHGERPLSRLRRGVTKSRGISGVRTHESHGGSGFRSMTLGIVGRGWRCLRTATTQGRR